MAKQKKNGGEAISWGLIVFLFFLDLWPIALILLFVKLFASDEKKQQTAPPPLRTESTAQTKSAAQSGAAAEKKSGAVRAAKSVTRQPKMKPSNAMLLQIIGGLLAFFALVGGSDYFGRVLSGNFYWLDEVLSSLAMAAAGAGMFAAGWKMNAAMKRYPRYLAVMGDRSAVSVDEMCRKLGYSREQVEKDLQKMLDKGYFGTAAYLNVELGYFFRSAKADAELHQQQAERPKTPAETEEGFSGILRSIRRANDRIADPALSEQIDRLEAITARIFRAVEEDPAKLGRISTFMNYYLPTTQKLLDSYAEFESAGVEGENLRQAKANIRKTMESIVEGFEHQLDALYGVDAMNVDKDIRVMETMLRRDTASVEKDFGLGKTATPAAPKTTDVDLGGTAAQQQEE